MESIKLALARPQTPQLDELENELTLSPTVRNSTMRRQLNSQSNNQLSSQLTTGEPIGGTGKKRKNDSPLK
jgi:hypothetical protein